MDKNLVRLGAFTAMGLIIIVGFSFFVNDQPFWYRTCNLVDITVDDATGLRRKSPVKTLGLDIGYIQSVNLDGENVVISVCVTAPVKLRPDTKAYVRSIGFLGDRFLELKPVDVVDEDAEKESRLGGEAPKTRLPAQVVDEESALLRLFWNVASAFSNAIIPSAEATSLISEAKASTAYAQKTKTLTARREAELSDTMKKVGKLVDQLTLLTGDLRKATKRREFRDLVINLNKAAKHMADLMAPEGELSEDLKAAMKSFRGTLKNAEEIMARVNRGEGSMGKLLVEEDLYNEAKAALKSLNLLLGKAGNLAIWVDLSAHNIEAYDGSKARLFIKIEPNPGRYYLLGVSTDPRGAETRTTTETITDGVLSIEEKTVTEERGIKFTIAFGKYFGPLDLKVGLIESAGTIGAGYWFDKDHKKYAVMAEVYKESKRDPIRYRVFGRAKLYSGLYVKAGVEDFRQFNGTVPYFFGIGLFFNDEDIKYLLAFK